MRPILFEDAEGAGLSSTYLWGDSFLVAPITEPGAARKEVYFPNKGSVWFDFYTDKRHRGAITEVVPVAAEHIPVFVRAGAFVPLAKVVQTTRDYSAKQIDLHYYYDASAAQSSGKLYDDDGATASAFEQGKYELVRFSGKADAKGFELAITTETGKSAQAQQRGYKLIAHNVLARPRTVALDGKPLAFTWSKGRLEASIPARSGMQAKLVVIL
jgi:alpha-glucosidase (family GH31 glycosyl hydrolase)